MLDTVFIESPLINFVEVCNVQTLAWSCVFLAFGAEEFLKSEPSLRKSCCTDPDLCRPIEKFPATVKA